MNGCSCTLSYVRPCPRFTVLSCLSDVQDVTDAFISSRAPSQQDLSESIAALQQLQHAIGHGSLSRDDAMYLLLFIFRPFLAHTLTNTTASTAPCTLALLQLLQHVLQLLLLGTGQAQPGRQKLAAILLDDLAACSFYSRDPHAAKWLASDKPATAGTAHYVTSNTRCPKAPLPTPAAADSSSSSTAPGLQALLDVLQYAPGSWASGIDSACLLAQELVARANRGGSSSGLQQRVAQALPTINMLPLFMHWLTPRVVVSATTSAAAGAAAPADLSGAVGKAPFSYSSSYSRNTQATEVSVLWSDGSRQSVHAGFIPPRHNPEQLVLAVLTQCAAEQLSQHMQSLSMALQQLCSPGADADASGPYVAPQSQQQQHAVQCIMQLLEHSAGLDRAEAAGAASSAAVDGQQDAMLSAVLACISQHILANPLSAQVPGPQPLQQLLLCKLALLLLGRPLPDNVVQQVSAVVAAQWPLQDAQLRLQWLRCSGAPRAATAASAAASAVLWLCCPSSSRPLCCSCC
jgi:hypothetical protein